MSGWIEGNGEDTTKKHILFGLPYQCGEWYNFVLFMFTNTLHKQYKNWSEQKNQTKMLHGSRTTVRACVSIGSYGGTYEMIFYLL